MSWAIPLALTGSLSWGISDFIGGQGSRHRSTLAVMALSRPVGLAAVIGVALATSSTSFDARVMLGLFAGPITFMALFALYRGLALGPMGVVSPIAAMGSLVPVVWGAIRGQDVPALTYLGLGGAVAGVMLASSSLGTDGRRLGRSALLWALISVLGFGSAMILLSEAGRYHAVEAVVVSRGAEVVLIALLSAITWRTLRSELRPPYGLVPLAGPLDTAAILMFTYASAHGALGVASVLSSLYPVVTVLIARARLHERLSRTQQLGAIMTLLSVVLVVSQS